MAKLSRLSPEAIGDAFGLIYQSYMQRESVPHTVYSTNMEVNPTRDQVAGECQRKGV